MSITYEYKPNEQDLFHIIQKNPELFKNILITLKNILQGKKYKNPEDDTKYKQGPVFLREDDALIGRIRDNRIMIYLPRSIGDGNMDIAYSDAMKQHLFCLRIPAELIPIIDMIKFYVAYQFGGDQQMDDPDRKQYIFFRKREDELQDGSVVIYGIADTPLIRDVLFEIFPRIVSLVEQQYDMWADETQQMGTHLILQEDDRKIASASHKKKPAKRASRKKKDGKNSASQHKGGGASEKKKDSKQVAIPSQHRNGGAAIPKIHGPDHTQIDAPKEIPKSKKKKIETMHKYIPKRMPKFIPKLQAIIQQQQTIKQILHQTKKTTKIFDWCLAKLRSIPDEMILNTMLSISDIWGVKHTEQHHFIALIAIFNHILSREIGYVFSLKGGQAAKYWLNKKKMNGTIDTTDFDFMFVPITHNDHLTHNQKIGMVDAIISAICDALGLTEKKMKEKEPGITVFTVSFATINVVDVVVFQESPIIPNHWIISFHDEGRQIGDLYIVPEEYILVDLCKNICKYSRDKTLIIKNKTFINKSFDKLILFIGFKLPLDLQRLLSSECQEIIRSGLQGRHQQYILKKKSDNAS